MLSWRPAMAGQHKGRAMDGSRPMTVAQWLGLVGVVSGFAPMVMIVVLLRRKPDVR